jgi:hypothetical protein
MNHVQVVLVMGYIHFIIQQFKHVQIHVQKVIIKLIINVYNAMNRA